MSRQLLKELNRFRADPSAYAEEMDELRSAFVGLTLTFPSGAVVQTIEGVSALEGLLLELEDTMPLPEFIYSLPMSRACKIHLKDLQDNDFFSHIGSDGTSPEERLAQFGRHREQCGENIIFQLTDPKEILWHMLIDDGYPERGHRGNLLSRDLSFVGICTGTHPSVEHCTVMLFVDHFRPKHHDAASKMAALAKSIASAKAGSGTKWSDIVASLKPKHLKCGKEQMALIDRLSVPINRSAWKDEEQHTNPVTPMGSLNPQSSCDPTIVRAFVHRVDTTYVDAVNEQEVLNICKNADRVGGAISPIEVRNMFNDIISKRAPSKRFDRSVTSSEVYRAIEASKDWCECLNFHYRSERYGEGQERTLAFQRSELIDWFRKLQVRGKSNGLNEIPDKPSVAELQNWCNQLLDVIKISVTIRNLVDNVLDTTGSHITSIKIPPNSDRSLWCYHTGKFRTTWLRIMSAVQCDPTIPMKEKGEKGEKAAALLQGGIAVTNKEPRLTTLSKKSGKNVCRNHVSMGKNKVVQRKIADRVEIRPKSDTTGSHMDSTEPGDTIMAESGGPRDSFFPQMMQTQRSQQTLEPWEEKRKSTEDLINKSLLSASDVCQQGSVSFVARRRFLSSMAKQVRASNEAKFTYRAAIGQKPTKSTGSGAFSLTAPRGVTGHFHHSVSATTDGLSGQYPITQDVTQVVEWNGSHIDHTKNPYVFEDLKYSLMPVEERRTKHFNTLPNPELQQILPLKTETALALKDTFGPWQPYKEPEFRADRPDRHGRFGRRVFDPQVQEKQVSNPKNISEIDNIPIDKYNWQLERYQDFYDHHIPTMHGKKFQQCLPRCQNAMKNDSMATRQSMLDCVTVGDRLHSQICWGQTRHSDINKDIQFTYRPLGTTTMDKMLDLGPVVIS